MRPPRVNEKALLRFRRRACRKYPLEYVEMLWGKIDADGVTVVDIVPFPHKATKNSITYIDPAFDEMQALAEEHDLQYLGSIHSHPDAPPIPSHCDNEGARQYREVIFGILEIQSTDGGRKRTKVVWWEPQHPLEPRYFRPTD